MKKALLDPKGRLIGAKAVRTLAPGDVDPGDLPTDGSYKWDAERGAFIPAGHGFGKVQEREPWPQAHVLALMVEHAGEKAPAKAREWLDWYNAALRARDEEKR